MISRQVLLRSLLSPNINGTNTTSDTTSSLDLDMNIDYRYMPDGMYIALVAIAISSCLLSLAGSTSILYFLLISNPRNGSKQYHHKQEQRQQKEQQKQNGNSEMHRRSSTSVSETRVKLGLYHRLLVGLSITDWISSLILAVQPLVLPKSTQYYFAIGNMATCRVAGFLFQSYRGSHLYSAALSVYFYLTIRLRKKEEEAAAVLEPYTHIISVVVPVVLGALSLSFDMIHPSVLFMICRQQIKSNLPECATTTAEQQNALGINCTPSLAEYIIVGCPPLIAVVSVCIGIAATVLVYWTVHQQTMLSRRHSFSMELSTTQLARTRAVGRQAILYCLAYLNSFVLSIVTVVMVSARSRRNIGDPADMYGSAVLYAAMYFMYLVFPLQGFFNCIIFMRPRVMKWQEAEPDQSWFWCYRRVLSGYPPPTRRQRKVAGRLASGGRTGMLSGSNLSNNPYTDSVGSTSSGGAPSAPLSPSPTKLAGAELCLATTSEVVVANAHASEEFQNENIKFPNRSFNEHQTGSSDREADAVVKSLTDEAVEDKKRIDITFEVFDGGNDDHSISH